MGEQTEKSNGSNGWQDGYGNGAAIPTLQVLRDHFLTRQDILAWKPHWGEACPTRVNDLNAMLTAHLLGSEAPPVKVQWTTQDGKPIEQTGHFRLGTYCPGTDSLTVFGCVDCDGGGRHGNPLVDPLGVALRILDRLDQVGIGGYLEKSGSGTGWHVWVLFASRVLATKVRKLLFAVLPKQAALAKEGFADARRQLGIEVFPKQDSIAADGQGNMVWLPWWRGAKNGGNLFYRIDVVAGEISPYVPEFRAKPTEADLDAALVELTPKASSLDAALVELTPKASSLSGGCHQNGDGRVSHVYLLDRALNLASSGKPRNNTGFWLACQLRDNGHDQAMAETTLRDFVRLAPEGDHDYREREAIASVKQAYSRPPRHPWERAKGFRQYEWGKSTESPDTEPQALPIVTCGQLLRDYPERRLPIIEGLLRVGETMNVIAAPKVGKSWLAQLLAFAVGTGRPWLGFPIPNPGRVLLIDNELHRETIAHRLRTLAGATGLPPADIEDSVHVLALRGQLRDLVAMGPGLLKIGAGRYGLVIVDAFYRTLPADADENSNGTMAALYNHLDNYADALGAAFAVVHHTSKGSQSNKSVTDVGAGAGAQSRATDTHLVLRAHEVEGAVVLDAAARSWPPVAPICLRWDFPAWQPAPDLDPTALRSDRPRKARPEKEDEHAKPADPPWTAERFAELFGSVQPRNRERVLEDTRPFGLSDRLAEKLLRRAIGCGLLFASKLSGTNSATMISTVKPEPFADKSVAAKKPTKRKQKKC